MPGIDWFKGGSAGSQSQDSMLSLLSIIIEGILSRKLDQVVKALNDQGATVGEIMATLQDIKAKQDALLASLSSEKSLNQSILKLLQDNTATIGDLGQKLKDAINNQDPAALQAVSDEMDQLQTAQAQNMNDLASAVTVQTPAQNVPTAPPVTPVAADAATGGGAQGTQTNP